MAGEASSVAGFDPPARYAALDERVTNLRTGLTNLESEVRTGFVSINSAINTLSSELRNTQKTPWALIWSAMGVCMTIATAIGALAYMPIRQTTNDLQQQMIRLSDKAITRDEVTMRLSQDQLARLALEAKVEELRSISVARPEWGEARKNTELQLQYMSKQMDDLQKQIQALNAIQMGAPKTLIP